MNFLVFKTNYIVELADTLSGHYYGVWRQKTEKVFTGERLPVVNNPIDMVPVKGRFQGYYPSVSNFLNAYPTSEHLVKWIADNGFHESRAMRDEAGRRGTRIHTAIEDLLNGFEITRNQMIPGHRDPLTTEEWHKLHTFVQWHESYQPEILALEVPIFSKKGKYAGRVDCICRIQGMIYVLDWKSSANVHKSFPLQFSAYAYAIEENCDIKIDAIAALQLGAKNKNGYRFIIYDEWRKLHYPVFQHVRATWLYDNYDSLKNPKELPILNLPMILKLDINKLHESKEETGKVKAPGGARAAVKGEE